MEAVQAVQARPVGGAFSSRFAPESSSECVESRLALIPTVPSSIIIPTTSSDPRLERVESFSSSAAGTKSTEAATSNSTTATSVFELPRVFSVQKIHVSPGMQIDERVQAIWTTKIWPRLSGILSHSIPKGTCVQEFMMVCKQSKSFKPAVIISCGDHTTKKRVEQTFKSQAWLQELLKVNDIMFIALVAPTTLSAGAAAESVEVMTIENVCTVQHLLDEVETSCGQAILVGDTSHKQRRCTLGGLLAVNGKIMGLTAGHPFHLSQAESALARSDLSAFTD